MSKTWSGATWLLGVVFTVACSFGDGENGGGSASEGFAAPNGSSTGGSLGPYRVGDATGGEAALVFNDGPTEGVLDAASGGGSSTGETAGSGGSVPEQTPSGGNGGIGTTDPGPATDTGGNTGTTTDPPPPATGGTTGDTTDPPPGDTEDPPPGDTEDPPPGDTEDPPPGDTEDPPPGDTEDPPPGDTEDPPPGDTEDPPPVDECVPTEMTDVNVIVFEDAEPTGADSEGRMYVGGNATFEGYSIGSREEADCSRWDLVVGGDLTATGGSVNNGKIAVGGTFINGSGFTASCGVFEGETPVNFEELEARMIAYSEAMAAYPANGEVLIQYDTLYLTGTDPELNVFSVTATELANNLTLDVPEGSSVIVNVSGTEVIWSGKGFELPDGGMACRGETSDWCHSIMYNMYEATSLELSGIGVQGSILAPYATFNGSGGNVDGQLIVRNLYGGIEFHPYFFSGCLLLPEVEGSL